MFDKFRGLVVVVPVWGVMYTIVIKVAQDSPQSVDHHNTTAQVCHFNFVLFTFGKYWKDLSVNMTFCIVYTVYQKIVCEIHLLLLMAWYMLLLRNVFMILMESSCIMLVMVPGLYL